MMTEREMRTTTSNDEVETANGVNSEGLRLHKNLGLIRSASYVTGGIIGVGIFVSPQSVLLNTGQSVGVALCVWAFCAFNAFCGALCYAELGTRIRKSGGSYTYARAGFGDGAGFLFSWTQVVVVRPLSLGLAALTAAEYTLRPLFLDCPHLIPKSAKILLALCILGILVFLSSYNTSWGATIQILSTVCKVSALVVIIIIGIVFLCKTGGSGSLQDLFSPQDLTVGSLTLAIYSCNYAYTGWDTLNMGTEEVKNSQRNVPLAIVLGLGLTAVVYLLAIVSYHAVLSTSQILSGIAVAAAFTDMTVPALMWFIIPCIAVSATGIVNVGVFIFSRMNFIAGRDGLFPEILSMVNVSRKTPVVSCLVLLVTASVVILMGDITSVLASYSFFRAAGETFAILGMFRLRRIYPASAHTYVAPTVIVVLFLVINISLPITAIARDTSRYVIPLLMVLSGIPLYFLSTSSMFRQGPLKRINESLEMLSRKLLLCDFASKNY